MDKKYFKPFEGKVVRIFRGPQYITGKILSVQEEYFILFTLQSEITFIQLDHIHSIGEDVKENYNFPGIENKTDLFFINKGSLCELMHALKYQMIKINDGPESVIGIISDVSNDSLRLVDKQVVRTIYVQHLKSISIDINLINDLNRTIDSVKKIENDKENIIPDIRIQTYEKNLNRKPITYRFL